jgi:hypothetical protein
MSSICPFISGIDPTYQQGCMVFCKQDDCMAWGKIFHDKTFNGADRNESNDKYGCRLIPRGAE